MLTKRLLASVVSALVFALIGLVGARSVASFAPRAVQSARALLAGGVEHVQADLASKSRALAPLAEGFGQAEEVPGETRKLVMSLDLAESKAATPGWLKDKISRLRSTLRDRMSSYRRAQPAIDGMTLVTTSGVVAVNDGGWLEPGDDVHTGAPPAAANTEGSAAAADVGDATAAADVGDATAAAGGRTAAAADVGGATAAESIQKPAQTAGSTVAAKAGNDSAEDGVQTAASTSKPGTAGGTQNDAAQVARVEAPETAAEPAGAQHGEPAGAQHGDAAAADPMRATDALIEAALAGAKPEARTVVREGEIVQLAAALVRHRGKQAAVVIVESRVRNIAQPSGAEAALFADGKPILGSLPGALDAPPAPADVAGPLVPKLAGARLLGMSTSLPPLFVDATGGIWGHPFAVPETPISGLVTTDLEPLFAELAGMQWLLLLLAGAGWLVHLSMVWTWGRNVRRGVDAVADVLSKRQQGMAEGQSVNENALPVELRRLARLVNGALQGQYPATAPDGAWTPKQGTSVDEVLQAQALEPPPDLGELEFEGITNAGSMVAAREAVAAGRGPEAGQTPAEPFAEGVSGGDEKDSGTLSPGDDPQHEDPMSEPPPPPADAAMDVPATAGGESKLDAAPEFETPSLHSGTAQAAPSDAGAQATSAAAAASEPDTSSDPYAEPAAASEPDTSSDPYAEPAAASEPDPSSDPYDGPVSASEDLMAQLEAIEGSLATATAETHAVADVAASAETELDGLLRQPAGQQADAAAVAPDSTSPPPSEADTSGSDADTSALDSGSRELDAAEPEPSVADSTEAASTAQATAPAGESAPEGLEASSPASAVAASAIEANAAAPEPSASTAADARPPAPEAPLGQATAQLAELASLNAPPHEPTGESRGEDTPAATQTDAAKATPESVATGPADKAPQTASRAESPSPSATDPGEQAASANGSTDQYQAVYNEFIKTRKRCGESTELSLAKFRARLEQTKNAVLAKHQCKDVNFQVYVKNGKAALKATPRW